MASIPLNADGSNTSAVTVSTGDAQILSAAGRDFIVYNNTRTRVKFTATPGSAVSLELGTAVAREFNLAPGEFQRVHLTKNAGTGAANDISVAAENVETAHMTSAQVGQVIYMVAEG